MSSSRGSVFSAYATRRLRRPTLSLAHLLLLLCLGAHALGQTFQYSRGWTNGRKRAFSPPATTEARKELFSGASSTTDGDDFPEEGSSVKERNMPEGRMVSVGPMDQGRLETLLMLLGNSGRDAGGEEGEEFDMMKQKSLALGGRRKAGWRRNSLSESFLRRRRRRVTGQREASVATLN